MWWGSSLLSGHLCPVGMGSDPKLPEQKPLAPTDSVPFVSVFFPFSAVGPPTSLITARKCWSQWGSCQSQTEVRVVSDELSLQGSIFASLIWVSPSLSPVSSTMLWSHLQQHHLLYCRASRVVWTLDMYWQVSCGGVAAVRNLGCVYCASWVITNNGCYCLTPGDWGLVCLCLPESSLCLWPPQVQYCAMMWSEQGLSVHSAWAGYVPRQLPATWQWLE